MAIYDISTLGTTANNITFNDFDYVYNTGVLFRVQKRTPNRREIREFDIAIPETNGVADYQTFIGKSYFVIEGTMYPDDETFFDLGREKLRRVSSLILEQADGNADHGYVPYTWDQTNGQRQLFVKVLYVDIPESSSIGIVQPFRILCKVKRPVIYSSAPQSEVIGVTSPPTSTGNSGLSFALPVLLGANIYTYSGTLTNSGDLPTYPSFVITGAANRPKITNNSTGEFIEIDVNLSSSDSLAITYDEDDVIITVGGNSVYNKLVYGSTLFKIKPGTVSFSFSGSSVSPGASATASFYSAWPLS